MSGSIATGVRARLRTGERHSGPGGLRRTPFSYAVLTAFALFAGLPLLVLLSNAFKSNAELGRNPLGLPTSLVWSNFSSAWVQGNLRQGMLNSAILVAGVVAGVWVCATLAAYALARLDLPFRRAFGNYLFVVISLPVQMFLVPLFFLWVKLGLINTLQGLIVVMIATHTPFATLLLRTFLVSLPRELDEAARVDGANEWQVAWRIILPNAMPGFLTVGLVTGLGAYNELFFAVTFISDPNLLPISTAYLQFSTGYTTDYGLMNAGAVIMIVPVVLLFLALQRKFISGFAGGGVKA
jgi:raffinose/stachyose/melibiose transport system permease protein